MGSCAQPPFNGAAAMGAGDKLFYWVFQQHPDRILELLPDLVAGGGGRIPARTGAVD
ncbi:MAG: hypothetical protein ACKO02_12540 [Cyanobium sp.]